MAGSFKYSEMASSGTVRRLSVQKGDKSEAGGAVTVTRDCCFEQERIINGKLKSVMVNNLFIFMHNLF